MILAIDIGNTNIVIGCVDQEKTYFIERISTDRSKTELEYAIMIKNVLDCRQRSGRWDCLFRGAADHADRADCSRENPSEECDGAGTWN